MRRRLVFAGAWLWLWGLWHLAWAFGLFLSAPLFGGEFTIKWFLWLYVVFLPLELVGFWDLRNDKDPDKVRPKTLSQWRQWVASNHPKDNKQEWLGWKGVAAGTGLIDACIVSYVLYTFTFSAVFGTVFGLVLSILVGLTIAAWLMPHFGWTEKFG